MKHVNPYNTVELYVGEITSPQTVKIYTDSSTSVDVQVSGGNKWYTYLLPKDKGLYKIEGDSVKKVVVKANISYEPNFRPPFFYGKIIPTSTVEASFKCSKLNITDIKCIFQYCTSLTSLDLSNFNTSNVTDIRSMFSDCRGLTSLDVSNFDTSNVTDMSYMFYGCSGLASLDLSNFDTSNVTSMSSMFEECSNLTSLDLSCWVINDATDTGNMFNACDALEEIKMVGCTQDTINKIKAQLKTDLISIDKVNIITE